MTPAEVLDQAQAGGVTLWAEGDALRYRGLRGLIAKLLPALKAHKPANGADRTAEAQGTILVRRSVEFLI